MRYHAVVHAENTESVFECYVMAENTGAALEKVKIYLRNDEQEDLAKMLISLIEYREYIQSDLLLIP